MNITSPSTPDRPLRRRWPRRLVLASLLLVPLLAIPALASDHLRVTTPVRVTAEDPNPSRTYQDPSMVAHPEDPTTVLVGAPDLRGRTCATFRSTNTGHSWELLDASPMVDPDIADCFHTGGTYTQTPMATGGDGRIYMGVTNWPSLEDGPRDHAASELNVNVAVSDDAGDSWTTTMVRDSQDFDAEGVEANRVTSIAVEPRDGDDDVVYVTWQTRYGETDDPPLGQPQMAVSTDGGDSFSEPFVPLPADVEEELGGEDGLSSGRAQLAMGDDGTVYAVFSVDPDDEDEESRLALTSSGDQGETWAYGEVTDPEEMPDFAYEMIAWSPEAGGTVHVVYESDVEEQPTGTRDIFHQRTTDGGETWSEPQMLNDDGPDSLAGQYNAIVQVAPNGRVDVAWFDFRVGHERYASDIYYAYSEDNGESWSDNVRVTDQSSNRHVGTWSNDFDMRGSPGLVSADDYALVAWSDTRNADAAGQSQDIYSAAVQHEDLGGAAGVLPLVLAAAGGIFAAGALLLGVGLGLRQQAGDPRQAAPAAS